MLHMHTSAARRANLVIPTLSALGVVSLMTFIARRRLDMVDESYLLRVIADPQATVPVGEIYLFGFVLHPIYEVVGRDVAVLRLVGFGAVALGAAALSREVLMLLSSLGVRTTRGLSGAVSIVAAASSLLVFSFNVTVPAYRSLALLGLMATTTGLVRAYRRKDWSAGSLLGVGLWLTFVGKPPSAAALVLVLLPLVVHFRLARARVLLACTLTFAAAVGGTLLAAQMSVAGAVGYLSRGAHHSELLGSHSDVRAMLGLGEQRLEGLLIFGPLVVAPLLAALLFRRRARSGRQPLVDLLSGLMIFGWTSVVAAWAAHTLGSSGFGWQFLSLGLLLPALAGALIVQSWRKAGGFFRLSFPSALVAFLMVLPWVSAVGSNVSFSVGMPLASVFWVLAVAVLSLERDSQRSGAEATPILLTSVATLIAAMTFVVHRDGSFGGDLGADLERAPVAGGELLLPPPDAEAARSIRAVAVKHAVTRDTPVVDLTGVGAGYAFLTGGRPLGRAHMYGYLPNSVGAAQDALATASCADRRSAWLIYAPRNPWDLSRAFIGDRLSLETDYEVMATFTATSVRGTWEMSLLRPSPSVGQHLGC